MPTSLRNTAYIYADTGVSGRSLKALASMLKSHLPPFCLVKTIDAHTLHTSPWEQDAFLIAFPGGRDVPYHEKLSGEGCQKIRSFVEKGGRYLGICAGAYFGCHSFVFEKDSDIEVIAERELGFYPGSAFGPALGSGTFCYESEKGSEAALIDWEQKKIHIYYNGGCAFQEVESHPNVQTLAHYSSLENNPPAVVLCSLGTGKALLSGIHIEMSSAFLSKNDPYLHHKIQKISEAEKERFLFCEAAIQKLLD